MQSGFVKAICQVGIFMICAQAIIHFRPKAVYEKYLKMLVSAMILIQLLVSVSGMFSPEGEGNLMERAAWFAESMEKSMQKNIADSRLQEGKTQDIVNEEVWKKATQERQHDEVSKSKIVIDKITVELAPVVPVQK